MAVIRRKISSLVVLLCFIASVQGLRKLKRDEVESLKDADVADEIPEMVDFEEDTCQCAVFLSQQVGIKGGRRSRPRGPPTGEPVVIYDTHTPSLPCGQPGIKHCIGKCLDVILKYLPRAGPVICSAVERDVHREKAFLFVKNCGIDWTPTNFSAGKDFCCTDGEHHKC